MTVDLTDVSPQVQGFYNSGETAGRSCAQVAFKCLTSALDLPINEGQFRALDIVLPPGRVVSAQKPAAMRMWMTYPMTIVDTIFKALAPGAAGQVIAGHHADLVVGRINGRRPKDNSFYIYLGGLIGGGWGAKHDSDGRNATIAMNDGDTHNGPSEQVEAKYPLIVERYCLRPDSGGAGRYRGGLGTEQVVQARHPIRFSARRWTACAASPGACSAACRALAIRSRCIGSAQTDEERFPNGKALNQTLAAGDAYILRSGGGGGYGSPLDRDIGRCSATWLRLCHPRLAETLYGAVFTAGTLDIDPEATAASARTCATPACRMTSRSRRCDPFADGASRRGRSRRSRRSPKRSAWPSRCNAGVAAERVIPKSVQRFSDQITRREKPWSLGASGRLERKGRAAARPILCFRLLTGGPQSPDR